MKSRLKLLSAILVFSALLYTACKKTSSTSSGPTLTQPQVASQVALNIYQSLFGGLAGVDLSGGINSASTFAVHHGGKAINDLSDPTCGLSVDTTIKSSFSIGDSSISINGRVQFGFACTNGIISSFTTNDNVAIGFTSPSLKLSYQVAENLTVTALDPSNYYSNVELDGSLNSSGSYQNLTGNKGSGTTLFDYTLKKVIAAGDGSGDVLSGTATFNTQGTGPRGVWNDQGTITFEGNFTALVNMNGKTFTVNLQTGATN